MTKYERVKLILFAAVSALGLLIFFLMSENGRYLPFTSSSSSLVIDTRRGELYKLSSSDAKKGSPGYVHTYTDK